MLEAIQNRELIVLDCLGTRLQGTLHRPAYYPVPTAPRAHKRVGVLFLNSLSLPRAASGDSAVHWASSIAEQGYPSFRIDLPGLGDSDGQASPDLLDFINAGGFAAAATAVARQLTESFALSGVVIFGHCAGSVTALNTGAASADCKGLILLDPYFHLPQAKRPKVREELSDWARRSKVGRVLSNTYDRVRHLRLFLRGNVPPANANAQLLARWKQVAAAALPVLLLKAPGIKAQGAKPRVGEFDYTDHVLKLAGRKSRVSADFVEGADHSFANREGRDAVQRHITAWLAAHFPLPDLGAANLAPQHGADNQSDTSEPRAQHAEKHCALEAR